MFTKNDSEMEITSEEFDEIVINSQNLVVVNFFAEWNMTCLMLAPVVEDIAEQMKEVKFVKVNMDDNRDLASKCKISSVPCLVMFKQGKEITRIMGNQTQEFIEEKIKGCKC